MPDYFSVQRLESGGEGTSQSILKDVGGSPAQSSDLSIGVRYAEESGLTRVAVALDQIQAFPETGLFTQTEVQLLLEVAGGVEGLERLVHRLGGDALAAMLHLVSEGYLEFVSLDYAWAAEYGVGLTDLARALHQS